MVQNNYFAIPKKNLPNEIIAFYSFAIIAFVYF
ncbi:hypothetical protein SAMN06265220_102133 [Flavobacterium nitrogenifigens]|uniref:Uncharacterized protein n=1 Tax=Flavobacterium nitrogenifigens TaxID=1617283 RepID=A0A521C9Z0_9FLAO|nr:hypothetical protein SAMN06265220_102133 [Flavobacterium nitrogenifigens]